MAPTDNSAILLKRIIDTYMRKVSALKKHCDRCLRTERWDGSAVLMVVDAAFTSIGLNYFTAVVPNVEEFRKKFVRTGKIVNLKELADADTNELRKVWRNKRSWIIAKEIASYLSKISEDDKIALRTWARNASLEKWKKILLEKLKVLV